MYKFSHLVAAGESYRKHASSALYYSLKLLYAAIAVLIHAIYPQWHQNTASDIARKIVNDVDNRHQKAGEDKNK
jgi:hypothetical protein